MKRGVYIKYGGRGLYIVHACTLSHITGKYMKGIGFDKYYCFSVVSSVNYQYRFCIPK